MFGAAIIGYFAFATLHSRAAIPGRPAPADAATIDACLSDAAKSKTDPDTCVGRVSSHCAEAATTDAATLECGNREFLVWDDALNRDYAQLAALLSSDNAKQALRDLEREFFVMKLKQCTFDRIARGNTLKAAASSTQCNAEATARQDLWVIQQINSLRSN